VAKYNLDDIFSDLGVPNKTETPPRSAKKGQVQPKRTASTTPIVFTTCPEPANQRIRGGGKNCRGPGRQEGAQAGSASRGPSVRPSRHLYPEKPGSRPRPRSGTFWSPVHYYGRALTHRSRSHQHTPGPKSSPKSARSGCGRGQVLPSWPTGRVPFDAVNLRQGPGLAAFDGKPDERLGDRLLQKLSSFSLLRTEATGSSSAPPLR